MKLYIRIDIHAKEYLVMQGDSHVEFNVAVGGESFDHEYRLKESLDSMVKANVKAAEAHEMLGRGDKDAEFLNAGWIPY